MLTAWLRYYLGINSRVYTSDDREPTIPPAHKFMLNYNDRMNSYLDIPRYIAVYVRGRAGSVSRRKRESKRAPEQGKGGEEG